MPIATLAPMGDASHKPKVYTRKYGQSAELWVRVVHGTTVTGVSYLSILCGVTAGAELGGGVIRKKLLGGSHLYSTTRQASIEVLNTQFQATGEPSFDSRQRRIWADR